MKPARLLLPLVLVAATAGAEVAVETNPQGHFREFRTGRHAAGGRVLYWDQNGGDPEDAYLNLGGDGVGDFAPVAVVQGLDLHPREPVPVVVWSHFDGARLDLVWSRWIEGEGWSEPTGIGVPADGDHTGVKLVVDPVGDVHALWLAAGGEKVVVWYSKLVAGAWSAPERLTNSLVDGRNARFVLIENELYVEIEDWATHPIMRQSFLKERFDP